MRSMTSMIMLALNEERNENNRKQSTLAEISTIILTWIEEETKKKQNIEALKSSVKYHLTELIAMDVVQVERRNRWIKYTLSDSVEILNGTISLRNGNDEIYEEDVGRVLRMVNSDGETMINMLDKT